MAMLKCSNSFICLKMNIVDDELRIRARSRSPVKVDFEDSVSESPISSENTNIPTASDLENITHESESETKPTCPVCLEPCIQPVKLPCSHIFCFLCFKGVHLQDRRCALCRKTISANYLKKPCLLEDERPPEDSNDVYRWFYQGKDGWWQYDDRTNAEIEETFEKGEKQLEVMIAGSMYNIDLEHFIQSRKDVPNRKRHIKRDLSSVSKKGVAGIKLKTSSGKKKKKVVRKKGKN